jgi:hypothetical protein
MPDRTCFPRPDPNAMKLNTTQKVLLGIFTILPVFLVGYVVSEALSFVMYAIRHGEEMEGPEVIPFIASIVGPALALATTRLALFILYIIHAINNPNINQTEKIIWALVFIFFGWIGCPIYFILRIWNDGSGQTAPA